MYMQNAFTIYNMKYINVIHNKFTKSQNDISFFYQFLFCLLYIIHNQFIMNYILSFD
jgi:hypothetical protein